MRRRARAGAATEDAQGGLANHEDVTMAVGDPYSPPVAGT